MASIHVQGKCDKWGCTEKPFKNPLQIMHCMTVIASPLSMLVLAVQNEEYVMKIGSYKGNVFSSLIGFPRNFMFNSFAEVLAGNILRPLDLQICSIVFSCPLNLVVVFCSFVFFLCAHRGFSWRLYSAPIGRGDRDDSSFGAPKICSSHESLLH